MAKENTFQFIENEVKSRGGTFRLIDKGENISFPRLTRPDSIPENKWAMFLQRLEDIVSYLALPAFYDSLDHVSQRRPMRDQFSAEQRLFYGNNRLRSNKITMLINSLFTFTRIFPQDSPIHTASETLLQYSKEKMSEERYDGLGDEVKAEIVKYLTAQMKKLVQLIEKELR